MSKDAASALKESLKNVKLPHGADIDTRYQKQTNSIEAWAEVEDRLTDEQQNEVYENLRDELPATFSHNGVKWDVDYSGLVA